jgi:hypothetical protein
MTYAGIVTMMKPVMCYGDRPAEGQALATERHDYRGYRILIRRYAGGWRATIYAPNSKQPILGPQPDDPTDLTAILDKAERLIDALLSP